MTIETYITNTHSLSLSLSLSPSLPLPKKQKTFFSVLAPSTKSTVEDEDEGNGALFDRFGVN